jgi:hypothetical protein
VLGSIPTIATNTKNEKVHRIYQYTDNQLMKAGVTNPEISYIYANKMHVKDNIIFIHKLL